MLRSSLRYETPFETPGSSIVSVRVGSWSVPFVFSVQRYLHGVIDLAVRSLDPATENVSRESYGALHPDNTRPHQVTWACPRFTAVSERRCPRTDFRARFVFYLLLHM